jgi:hypothetical protein
MLTDERQAPTFEVLKQVSRAGGCGCCAPVCGGSAATRVVVGKTAAGERSQGTGAVQAEASGAPHPPSSGPGVHSLSTHTTHERFRAWRSPVVAQFKRVDDTLADELAQAVPAERLPPFWDKIIFSVINRDN